MDYLTLLSVREYLGRVGHFSSLLKSKWTRTALQAVRVVQAVPFLLTVRTRSTGCTA